MKRGSGVWIVTLAALFLFAAPLSSQPRRLRIAIQPGIGYAHLIIMREHKMLERHLPGLIVERNLSNR